jgi:hypothetical protein
MPDTVPSTAENEQFAVQVDASVRDDKTGALWVHKDLVQVLAPWDVEGHIRPIRADEQFGDVESWAKYVLHYANSTDVPLPFATWNSDGLMAVLDYHLGHNAPGRTQWCARMPFTEAPEFAAWMTLADGRGKTQRVAIEALEDRAADIVEPAAGELMAMLRTLRTTVNKSAQTELRPDGGTAVNYIDDKGISARGGTVELPSEITIRVPILKGHVDDQGKPVVYELKVRLRASVGDDAHLALRFSIPNAERALEAVYADRVALAKRLLGDGFDVLRAAG